MATKQYRWYGKRVAKRVRRNMGHNLMQAAIIVAADIRDSFPSSGATGTASGGGDSSNRSVAGGIPFVQTGHLKRNIGYKKISDKLVRVGTGVGNKDSVGYALALEFGRHDGAVAARPFLRPGLKRNRRRIRKATGRNVI